MPRLLDTHCPPSPPSPSERKGLGEGTNPDAFTLFELILVLALIVVMGGMIVPALSGSFVYTKLHSAADDVQTAWADARLQAIERGHPVAFRCLLGGADFATTPYLLADQDLTVNVISGEPANENGEATLSRGTLADGLVFSEAATASALETADPGQRSSMRDTSDWSPPIVFYPDGQSSDALVQIAHEEGRAITVTLRGLTGISRKGEIGASGIAVEEGSR